MAHRARLSDRRGRPARRRPVRGDPGSPRRFIGPGILGIGGILLLAAIAASTGAASGGHPEPPAAAVAPSAGRVEAATGTVAPAPPPTAPPCTQGDVLTAWQAQDDWAVTILDTTLMLSADAAPTDLVPVGDAAVDGHGTVRQLVIDDLGALAAAARADGVAISVDSAYRSYDQQTASYASYVKGYGETEALRTVARPGHSEHQLGTTIDFAGDLDWLAANAGRYGFVMSYPPDASPEQTCYRVETWHFRYVGRDEAAAIRASGLSLREWLWQHQP